ncbi:MAG: hypothetical protein PHP52_09060 [Bacteroidales bacterium]|nr:hypothetical protein [Bacteroidales bacterium]MDD4218345.1 hypothetical protein [Bacteroidales bacterium]MDY0143738.1 hypothetical protein [Bacteroidales bacterium]
MNKTVGIIIKIALLGAIVALAYLIVVGINKPIEFEEQRVLRFNRTINRLKDIRTAQVAYKEVTGLYTPDFDTLIDFIKREDIRVVRAIGFVPDTLTEIEALKLGIVSRDTFYVPIIDSLFKHIRYPIDSMAYSPTGKRTKFLMDTAAVMTGSGVEVKVFQCYALNRDILDGLDNQLIINYNALKNDSCLRVGNLKEANNNAGNWE